VGATALIEHLQLVIAKMKREKFGPRSERSQRLIEQMDGRSSAAAPARLSRSHRRRFTRSRAALPGRACWR
jgi:Transposase C of IS166 homeodomain